MHACTAVVCYAKGSVSDAMQQWNGVDLTVQAFTSKVLHVLTCLCVGRKMKKTSLRATVIS